MFGRRILVLLGFFGMIMVALIVRLARWQIVDGESWKSQADSYTDRHFIIPTGRGTIYDRHLNSVTGKPDRELARDVLCSELQIDYRAMNLEDRWLRNLAIRRMKLAGITSRLERVKKLPDQMQSIADKLNSAPDVISTMLGIDNGKEQILDAYNEVRERIAQLRLNRELRFYSKAGNENSPPPDVDSESALAEERSFHTIWQVADESQANDLRRVFEEAPDPGQEMRWASDYPGIVVGKAKRRDYPYKDIAAPIIGYMRPVRGDELADDEYPDGLQRFLMPDLRKPGSPSNLKGYLSADDVGAKGIESAMEERLRGARGVKLVDLGEKSGTYREMLDAKVGEDIRLTLDIELQRELTQSLLDSGRGLRRGEDVQEHPVAVVVLRISDGQIMAMVSLPTFDLSKWDERKHEWLNDRENAPLLNRAVQSATPPGSTIKPLVAVAALSEHLVSSGETINCHGSAWGTKCTAAHGPLAMNEAIQKSCNVYFMTMGQRLGLERENQWYAAYGLGAPTNVEIGEARGGFAKAGTHGLGESEPMQEGMGQGALAATPLQMANAYATMLRNGKWIRPHLVMDTPVESRQVLNLDPAIVAIVKSGMRSVVTLGTARKTINLKLPTSGKTGTAEVTRPKFDENGMPIWLTGPRVRLDTETGLPVTGDNGKPIIEEGPLVPVYKTLNKKIVHDRKGQPIILQRGQSDKVKGTDAWFVGYAPADNPEYVVAAVMEFGGHGGDHAAPIFEQTVKLLERHGYLPPVDVPRRGNDERDGDPIPVGLAPQVAPAYVTVGGSR